MSHDPLDCFEDGLSDCCGARVMLGGICAACKEHCDTDKPEREFTPEQQATIDAALTPPQPGDEQ